MSDPRPVEDADHPAIDALLRAAFPGPEEAALVVELRATGEMQSEWVIDVAGDVVAHVALSRMMAPDGWLALAPLAVLPDRQGRGLGHRLTRFVVDHYVAQGCCVVVLGKPSFYAAAGFSAERAARLISRYPLAFTLLAGPGHDAPEERLVYPAAFAGV